MWTRPEHPDPSMWIRPPHPDPLIEGWLLLAAAIALHEATPMGPDFDWSTRAHVPKHVLDRYAPTTRTEELGRLLDKLAFDVVEGLWREAFADAPAAEVRAACTAVTGEVIDACKSSARDGLAVVAGVLRLYEAVAYGGGKYPDALRWTGPTPWRVPVR